MIIAGIGSRETPLSIRMEMFHIGQFCNSQGIIVRSGHARGADWAFEQGATSSTEVFVPWSGFGMSDKDRRPYLGEVIVPKFTPKIEELVRKYHPTPHKLGQDGMKLHGRNACQILGRNLDSPVDVVVCWTKDGGATGGTGQALRIASDHKIPILNMFHDCWKSSSSVIDELAKMSLTLHYPA